MIVIVVYFGCPPLFWLPFAPDARLGKPLPAIVTTFFTPIRILFDHCEPYHWLVYYEARLLGVDDFDYEGRILGTN